MGIGSSHQKEILSGIWTDFVYHLTQSDKLPGPFGHLNFLTTSKKTDHLDQHDSQLLLRVAKSLNSRLHPWDIPMMVSPPNIY